jgi:hypothetical protein
MSVLIVEAGTATSQRTREEPNAFNLLRVAPGRIEVDHYALRGGNFMRAAADAFERQADGWQRS